MFALAWRHATDAFVVYSACMVAWQGVCDEPTEGGRKATWTVKRYRTPCLFRLSSLSILYITRDSFGSDGYFRSGLAALVLFVLLGWFGFYGSRLGFRSLAVSYFPYRRGAGVCWRAGVRGRISCHYYGRHCNDCAGVSCCAAVPAAAL